MVAKKIEKEESAKKDFFLQLCSTSPKVTTISDPLVLALLRLRFPTTVHFPKVGKFELLIKAAACRYSNGGGVDRLLDPSLKTWHQ